MLLTRFGHVCPCFSNGVSRRSQGCWVAIISVELQWTTVLCYWRTDQGCCMLGPERPFTSWTPLTSLTPVSLFLWVPPLSWYFQYVSFLFLMGWADHSCCSCLYNSLNGQRLQNRRGSAWAKERTIRYCHSWCVAYPPLNPAGQLNVMQLIPREQVLVKCIRLNSL